MYWNDGTSAWCWLPMMFFMVAAVGVVVWPVLTASCTSASGGQLHEQSPEDLLAERLLAGDINAIEYRERLDTLHHARR